MGRGSLMMSRHKIFTLLTVAVFAVFLLRVVQLTVVDGEELYETAKNAVMYRYTVEADRGQIFDRNGVALVQNETSFNIIIERAFLPADELNDTLYNLLLVCDELGYTPAALYQGQDNYPELIERYDLADYDEPMRERLCGIRARMELYEYSYLTPYIFALNASDELLHRVLENSYRLKGVSVQESSVRVVTDGELMPHIIGSTGPVYPEEFEELSQLGYAMDDTLGRDGLEKAFEDSLRGQDGEWVIERNVDGEPLSTTVLTPTVPGEDLILTIDAQLQRETAGALARLMERLSDETGEEITGGAVVVMEADSGSILASVTAPSYDLNTLGADYDELLQNQDTPLFNRAFMGLYRPGSAFKPLVGIEAIESGVVSEIDTVYCSGSYSHFSDVGFTPGCTGIHGSVNLYRALQYSCNVYFYEMGRRLGIESFSETALAMGLARETGVEITEAVGILSTPEEREAKGEEWFVGDVVQAAIGQGDISVTPLQMAVYASTLANDGQVPTAHLVQGQELEVFPSVYRDSAAYDLVREGMVAASGYGQAAQYLGALPFEVASKTGTPQASNGFYDGTIIAYAPADNPEIVIAAVVEKAGNGYELAELVADVFLAYENGTEDYASVPSFNAVR